MKYYDLQPILSRKSTYNVIIGQRSNGKTFQVLFRGIAKFCENLNGENQLAIVRRNAENFKGKNGHVYFDSLTCDDTGRNRIEELTKGEYNGYVYYSSRWYLVHKTDGVIDKRMTVPFAYTFALTRVESDKSTSYPNISTIVFDEFIAMAGYYLADEFKLFMNTISTIVRNRGPEDVEIFMIGNTISPYCPYFNEMGLKHVKDQKKGTIDTYRYSDDRLTVSVEMCEERNQKSKPSDVFFGFDNPKLQMITGGYWELNIYPHCPIKMIKPNEILFTFFILYDRELLQCEVINRDELNFLFIHRKTTPLQDDENDLIFSQNFDPRPNWMRSLFRDSYVGKDKILELIKSGKIFYQDNSVGECFSSYKVWAES